jgi:hypothetical protein
MPTLDAVKAFRREMFESSMALIEQKGHDYNRQQQLDEDTLFNLKVAEVLGIVPTAERGILVRLSDKMMRLISLMSPGEEAAVKNESVRDTVRDFHNYLDYALMLWEERHRVGLLEAQLMRVATSTQRLEVAAGMDPLRDIPLPFDEDDAVVQRV